jgi:hypothetical protein
MTQPVPACTCGHALGDHADEGQGACQEPTGRCGCPAYVELCPLCRHAKPSHAGNNNRCNVIKHTTKEPCGCTRYVVPA